MKVLIVANYAKEHINKFHLTTIKRFKEMGWQVDVACRADAEVPYCDHLYDLPLERSPFRHQTILAIRKLRALIQKEKYDVVHCHTFAGKVTGIIASSACKNKTQTKIFYTAHGLQYYAGAPFVNWLALPLDRWLVSKTDLLLTVNQEDYDTAHRCRFRPKAIERHYGAGVKLSRFQQDTGADRGAVRGQLGIPETAIVLIYVAELNKNKNQSMLIRMFKTVREKYSDLHMLLVGPDHSHGYIAQLVQKEGLAGYIHCLGWRSDAPDLIRASDLAVASSFREGLGINLLEYMYCGIPVVASRNRGHKEIIRDGVNGYLVDPDNDQMMADRVMTLIEEEETRNRLIREARETVPQFADEKVVDDLIEIYRKYAYCR